MKKELKEPLPGVIHNPTPENIKPPTVPTLAAPSKCCPGRCPIGDSLAQLIDAVKYHVQYDEGEEDLCKEKIKRARDILIGNRED